MSGFDSGQGKDAFEKLAIALDPQIPAVARRKLRGEPPAGQSRRARRQAAQGLVLIRFRDPKPHVPLPRRPLTDAQRLAIAAAVLVVVAALTGLFGNLTAFLVFGAFAVAVGGAGWLLNRGAGNERSAGEPGDDHRDGWYLVEHAEKLYHRRYVLPRADLDTEARLAWGRAISAANRIYRSEVLRADLVDAEQVRAAVPEQLWRVAEGLAQISEIRYHHRTILGRSPVQSSAIAGKVAEQERQLARATRRVNQRVGRLEDFAALLTQADALRRGESVLDRLTEVDGLLRDLLATTEENAGDLDVAARLELEAQAVIDQATEAISNLAGPYDDEDPEEAGPGDPSLLPLLVIRARAYRASFAEI
jgi:hypothetical protein